MVVVFFLFCIGTALFCVQMIWHVQVILAGRHVARHPCLGARLKHTLRTTLGQTRIVERPWGWAHVILMWAFFVFLTSGLEMLVGCLVPGFTWHQVFGAKVHGVLCVIQTWFAWACIAALIVVTLRRVVARRMTFTNFDACFILADIFILMVTHILSMSAMIALGQVYGMSLMPLESGMADLMVPSHAVLFREVSSAIHLLMMAIFLVWIPNSKHLHIVTAWPDVFLFSRQWFDNGEPSYSPSPVDFDAYEKAVDEAVETGSETLPSIGLATFGDTTVKQRLEAFSCTLCRRCDNVCPMIEFGMTTQGPMTAMMRLRQMCVGAQKRRQRVLGRFLPFNKTAATAETDALVPEIMTAEALWMCTQCGACDRACPLSHEHTLRIMMLRQNAVAQQDGVPPGLIRCFELTERSGNPWGYPKKDRSLMWSDTAWPVPQTSDKTADAHAKKENVDMDGQDEAMLVSKKIALFAGCMASYDKKAATTLRRVRRWLEDAGCQVVMIDGETCCGEPLRRAGNEFGFEQQVRENIGQIQALQPNMILTACPHCAFTLGDSYRAYGMQVPVFHIVRFWTKLFDMGIMQVQRNMRTSLALHLPCYLAKYADEADRIVRLLQAAGCDVRQTGDARRTSCCGAGGGHFFYEDQRIIAKNRANALKQIGAEKIGTLCPFCTQMLGDELQNSDDGTFTTCVNVIDDLADCVQIRSARVPVSSVFEKKR